MPFTFSHPAMVLPFLRLNPNRISATAVILGSMAPDFEYFIRMDLYQEHGHTFWGIFYFNLPLVLLLTFIYQLYVRETLIAHLPRTLKRRFLPFAQIDWNSWVKKYWWVLIYSSLIGIFAHLFWDAFTHQTGIFVQHWEVLQGDINILGVILLKTAFLQLASTILGGFIILLYLISRPGQLRLWLRLKVLKYWSSVALVALFILALRFPTSISQWIATSISGFLMGIIVVSLLTKWQSKRLNLKRINHNET